MNLREVTVGRSPQCDIYLDQRCEYASNRHATIYYDGNQLMFRDHSSNGTLINNISVRKRAVPIYRGDTIMIAGKYPLNWKQIDSFFPYMPPRPVQPMPEKIPSPQPVAISEPLNLSRWSWGAFVLSGIWGFFNGCWWMFLVGLGFFVLGLLTAWIPFAPLILAVVEIGVSILFGAKGTEWAWNNRTWSSVTAFNETQDTWNKVGLTLFILSIACFILFLVFSFAAIASLFSI